jgi:peptide deformylase
MKAMEALHMRCVIPLSMSKNSLFTPKTTTPLSALPFSKPPLILTLSSSSASSSQIATVRTRAGWFSGLTDNKKKMNLPDTVKAGDPVLHEPAQEIDPSEIKSEKVQKIIDDMIRVMRKAPGVGLAAPQIGIPSRVSSILDYFCVF